jgi:hypothetical protein
MISIAEIELNISNQLQSLRDDLSKYDIPVTSLANNANMFYDSAETGFVKYFLSTILGFQYDSGTLMQRINITLTIAINVKKRYNDITLYPEYDNLDYIVDKVTTLLKNFIPKTSTGTAPNECCNSKIISGFYPMYLTSYRLMPAVSGFWSAELTYTIPIEL